MTFCASWLLGFAGEKIAVLGAERTLLFSDNLALRIAQNGDRVAGNTPWKRTFALLERRQSSWPIHHIADEHSRDWKLISSGEIFDSLCVECGENRRQKRVCALLAQGGASGKLSFQPTRFAAIENANLGLANARFAATFDGEQTHTALLARFDQSSWIHSDHCSLHVGQGERNAPFELTSDGENVALHCVPSLLAASVSLPDAICETVHFADAPRAAFRVLELAVRCA